MVSPPEHLLPFRYYAFSSYLKHRFDQRVQKIIIDAGFTCPNRDGLLGWSGCIYCNNESFSRNRRVRKPVRRQIEDGVRYLSRRYGAEKFIAYFQSYTNTYGSIKELERLYSDALKHPEIEGVAIGTRPDCIGEKVLDLLERFALNGYEVWLEIGLQSGSNETLERINRGHTVEDFFDAVERVLTRRKIKLCAHLILGFPWETASGQLATADKLAESGIHGLKLHAFHVVTDTTLEKMYRDEKMKLLPVDEYAILVCDFLERTPVDVVIQRLTSEAHEDKLIAPSWCGRNNRVLETIRNELESRGSWQGRMCSSESSECEIFSLD